MSFTILGICGSLRKASRNMGLLRCAREEMPAGYTLVIADISELPLFAEDRAKSQAAITLIEQVKSADAFLLACPEYNYSVAPALKNALDWVSREAGALFAGKPAAILGAGGGMGTARAQYHLRQTCVYLDLRVLNKPEVFAQAFSPAFAENGDVSAAPEGQVLRGRIRELAETLCRAIG